MAQQPAEEPREQELNQQELNEKLQQLKAKHQANSRLEALLMELNESRAKAAKAEAALGEVKAQLVASQQLVDAYSAHLTTTCTEAAEHCTM